MIKIIALLLTLSPTLFAAAQTQLHDTTIDSCDYYIPNTLTPDCDWYPCDILNVVLTNECPFRTFHIKIYNRWGEVLFESHKIDDKWDCTYKNEQVEDGTYVWQLNIIFESGQIINDTGHVNVIR